ncbi:MAG: hypothetical protein ACLFQJ_07020 [Campylobacterales bacterium]
MSINITQAYHNALYNKSAEQKRLSTPDSLDDYFKKQQATKEAMEHLQRGGSVPPEIAELVDVNALKKEIEDAKFDKSDSALASGIGGGSGLEDKVDIKGELPKADATESYAKCCQQAVINENVKAAESQKVQELVDKYGLKKEDVESFLNQKSVDSTNIKAPENAKELFNPLQKDQKSEATPYDVSFTDDASGEEVSVTLSPANAAKLQERFGSLDKASDFVKSWYKDAAYNVGYLTEDKDGDGKLNIEEAAHTKSMVDINKGENSYSSVAESFEDATKQKEFLEKFGFIDNINDFINHSISQDANLDGALSNAELLGENKFEVADVAFSGEEVDLFTFNSMVFERPANSSENISMFAKRASEAIVDEMLKDNKEEKEEV